MALWARIVWILYFELMQTNRYTFVGAISTHLQRIGVNCMWISKQKNWPSSQLNNTHQQATKHHNKSKNRSRTILS